METYEVAGKHNGGVSYLYIIAANEEAAIKRFMAVENAPRGAVQSVRRVECRVTPDDFTRVRSDAYGNPRYVVHYKKCARNGESYAETVKRMNKIGGRKFHNKQYGGGVAFQSYNLTILCLRINASR